MSNLGDGVSIGVLESWVGGDQDLANSRILSYLFNLCIAVVSVDQDICCVVTHFLGGGEDGPNVGAQSTFKVFRED